MVDSTTTMREDLESELEKNRARMARPFGATCKATPSNKPSPGDFVTSPRDVDIVGTRRRTWQHHPGNAFYLDLVQKNLPRVLEGKTSLRVIGKEIVEIVKKEKDAVFLRADEDRGGFYVMDESASLNKVLLALKNAEIKALKNESHKTSGRNAKRKQSNVKESIKKIALNSQDIDPPDSKIAYEVKEATGVTLDPYLKEIICLMCKQTNPDEAAAALDSPLLSHCKEGDPETTDQRVVRLQLRHRYIAAMAVGVSPVNFSRKLLNLWGASLVEHKIPIQKLSSLSELNTASSVSCIKLENVEHNEGDLVRREESLGSPCASRRVTVPENTTS